MKASQLASKTGQSKALLSLKDKKTQCEAQRTVTSAVEDLLWQGPREVRSRILTWPFHLEGASNPLSPPLI